VYLEKIQPELAGMWDGGGAYQVYKLYTDDVLDIEETDKVTDDRGITYIVKGVQHYAYNTDVRNHTEIVMLESYDKV
jgi:hypothetical protein